MVYDTVIRHVILIGIVQGLLFNVFVFVKRKSFDVSLNYLNIVVLCLSLNNIREFVFDGDFFNETFKKIYLVAPWYFFVVPMFYVFLIHYLKLSDNKRSYLKITYLIFIAETVLRVGLILFVKNFKPVFGEYMIIEEMCNAIYAIFIFYCILKLVFFDEKKESEVSKFDNLTWIKNILKFGAILMVLWVVAVIYYYFTRNDWVYDPLKVLYSVLIYWLGYQGLIHSKVLNDRISLRHTLTYNRGGIVLGKNRAVNVDKALLGEKHEREFNSLKNYVVEQQRFLDSQLSLEQLAGELKLSTTHLSKLINTYSSHNFSDFINSLRVEQAKKFLVNSAFDRYTVVAIGLECGFNSKSTFYSAFKKFTSKTPSSFRAKH